METLDLASQTCTVHTHLSALALSLLFFLEASDGGFSDLHLSAPSLSLSWSLCGGSCKIVPSPSTSMVSTFQTRGTSTKPAPQTTIA